MHPDQVRLHHEQAIARRREWVTEEFLKKGCRDCGITDVRVLEFHHRNPDEKSFGVMQGLTRSLEVLRQEIEKCDVLCANCHLIRHAERDRKD